MNIDLHLHTNHSDGTWSERALVEHAIKIGLKHIAITDHDTINGIEGAFSAAKGKIEIIPGIELNTVSRMADGSFEDVHILGYFIDVDAPQLQQAMELQQKARDQQLQEAVNKLFASGIDITVEKVRALAGAGTIGKPHLTRAIVEAGGAAHILEAYEKYTTKRSPFFVQRMSISPEQAISAIVSAGGIASLAHSGKRENVESLIDTLQAAGLGAVEAYHRMHNRKIRRALIEIANKRGLAITGGSDCHGPYEKYPPSIGSISVPFEVLANLKRLKQHGLRPLDLAVL